MWLEINFYLVHVDSVQQQYLLELDYQQHWHGWSWAGDYWHHQHLHLVLDMCLLLNFDLVEL